jgi:hypothetical protein
MFYNDLMPLNSNEHGAWRTRAADTSPQFASQHAIPLTVEEFVMAQRSTPIIFSTGPDPVPLALMGLNEGINTFVDEEGRMIRPGYVPAYVRRYPWMLAKLNPDSDDMSLCFDPTSELIGGFEDGQALLEDGQPTETTQQILRFCEEFEQAAMRTGQFVKELVDMDLLMDGEVSIELTTTPAKPFIYRGFQMVNEQKLRDMRGDQLRKISQNGMLPLLYAHFFSLQLMRELFEIQVSQGKGPPELNLPEPEPASA